MEAHMTSPALNRNGIAVTILGSGTCVPSLVRSSCSVLAETGDSKLVLDIGRGTIQRLLETRTTLADISHILISHLHPDHTGELVSFLFSRKYGGDPGPMTPLSLVGGKGFASFFRGLRAVYGPWIDIDAGMLEIRELDNAAAASLGMGGITIDSAPMEHSDESLAYRISTPGDRSLVYSGDTDVNDNLVCLARDADVLICESSFPDRLKSDGHLTPSLAGEIAAAADVGKLILTHFYPECDAVDIAEECRKTYDGPLLLAEDLMRITI